ncbi:HesA/MoeB/ThiF family protein [Frankia tisae]|uniref:HesA/MoeB/ThiF family protein n=1 Tax=Frankia tisae TaxID=2950104 RepID=UPI0021BE8577|nr:ThiF family adenylyltransferase [Frankia tisae]
MSERTIAPAPILGSHRYDRQIRAFGQAAQRRLAELTVAVVGAGGGGSLVVQGLAHLGVSRLVIVDPDVVESTDLARLVGATASDVGLPKVEVARRLVTSLAPDAQVDAQQACVLDLATAAPTARSVLDGADVLIGAVDRHAPRWALNRLAVASSRLYLDIGVELSRTGPAGDLEAGGHVAIVRPGGACLRCQDGYDPTLAAREQDPLTRAARRAAGYESSTSSPDTAASVLFLNQAVVALALAELVNEISPWRAPATHLLLDLARHRLSTLEATSDPRCPVCGPAASPPRTRPEPEADDGRGPRIGDLT